MPNQMYLSKSDRKIRSSKIRANDIPIKPSMNKGDFFNAVEYRRSNDPHSSYTTAKYYMNGERICIFGSNGPIDPKNKEEAYYFYEGAMQGCMVL